MSQGRQRILSAPKASIGRSNAGKRYQKLSTQPSQGSKKRFCNSFAKSRNLSRQLPKEPEQIMQQNLNLKSFINNLQQQLTMQRSKFQINKRKNEKYTRQFNRQFQKQIYYSGKNPNSYLVSGVKYQYDHIKSLYHDKCIQLEKVLKDRDTTDGEELKVYVETLETENKHLSEQLTVLKNIKLSFDDIYAQDFKASVSNPRGFHQSFQHNSGKLYTEQSEDKSQESSKHLEVLTGMLADERARLSRSNEIIERYSQKIDAMGREREQFKKKIEFLQKLAIEKDNNEHEAKREFKKVEREKVHLSEEVTRLKQLVDSTETISQNKIKKIEETEAKKYEIEKSIFDKTLGEKNQYISKLEKEIRSLSTMLCYWKPLDDKNDIQSSLYRHESPNSRDPREFEKEDKISSLRFNPQSENNRRESVVSDHSFLAVDFPGKTESELQKSMRAFREDEGFLKRTVTGNRSNSYQNAISAIKENPRRECSRKDNEKAKKTRKVDLNQIKQWGELLRYRLIGKSISLEKVKQYLNAAEDGEFEQYITMREIKSILMRDPFGLKEEEATLISRYVVEDSANEYVYWDEDNEINRNIAKSIIKTFIGDYQLPNLEMIREEWEKIKKIYLSNIVTALNTIAPKGLVTLTKFSELIEGLGIEMTESLREWIIGELVVNSASLEELRYSVIEHI